MNRPRFLGGLLVLCLVASGCATTGQEQGACAAPAPRVEARPARTAPAEAFRLQGEHFADRYDCDDAGPADGEAADPPRGVPERDIRIEFVQDGRTWDLGTVDSEEDLSFDVKLEVPADAKLGPAKVRATNRNYGPSGTRFVVTG